LGRGDFRVDFGDASPNRVRKTGIYFMLAGQVTPFTTHYSALIKK
jgi:hypothetical protein